MIFFFYGDNSFAMRREIERIRTHYIAKSGGDSSFEVFDLNERSLDELIRSVAIAPLFATSRLIIVRGLAKNKLSPDLVEQLLDSVPDSTVMIIEEREIDRRGKVFKRLAKLPSKNVKQFNILSPPELWRWVMQDVKKQGGEISSDVARLLVDRVGTDQWQLEQEITKLINYDAHITVESIEQLVMPNSDQTIFMLIDTIVAQDSLAALKLYRQLIHGGVSDQQILAMLNWHYRNLALAYDNQGGSKAWIKEFKISPYAAQKAERQVYNIDLSELSRAYKYIVEADLAIKTGVKSSQSALEDLIYQLTN